MDAVEALRGSTLLRALEERQLRALAGIARERTFQPGEALIRADTTGARAMFVILEGRVEVRRADTSLAILGPGDHVGEMAVLAGDDAARSADVIALEPVRVLQITKWDLFPFLKTNPDVALALLEELAGRLAATDARLAEG